MQKQTLYTRLLRYRSIYEHLHPKTTEIDIQIMKKFSIGKSMVEIAMEIPCAESTVYRARKRVQHFFNEELEVYKNTISSNIMIHNAIVRGRMNLSLNAHKLYLMCIERFQNFQDRIHRQSVHQYMQGLNNKSQRDRIINELNALTVITAEDPPRKVKIFEFVKYVDCEYIFELTEEAKPYFDILYGLFRFPS